MLTCSPPPASLVKEALPGPYIEGVRRRGGVRVLGLILAVTMARVRRMRGVRREEKSSFLSRRRFSSRFHSSARIWGI